MAQSLPVVLFATALAARSCSPAPPEETADGVTVLVARHDLPAGQPIDAADLEQRDLPSAMVPDHVLRHPAQATGRIPTERVLADEPVREERLLHPDMRPVTIAISAGSASGPLVEPGAFVDVLLTVPETPHRPASTRTLLAGVRVIAVSADPTPSVTLAATEDLVAPVLAEVSQGAVTLTRRAPDEPVQPPGQ